MKNFKAVAVLLVSFLFAGLAGAAGIDNNDGDNGDKGSCDAATGGTPDSATSTQKRTQTFTANLGNHHHNVVIDWSVIFFMASDWGPDTDTPYVKANLPHNISTQRADILNLHTPLNGFADFNRHGRNIRSVFFGLPAQFDGHPVYFQPSISVQWKERANRGRKEEWLKAYQMEEFGEKAHPDSEYGEIRAIEGSAANLFDVAIALHNSGLVDDAHVGYIFHGGRRP